MKQNFDSTAKSLAKNPLGIIALFIVLIYAFASLIVGLNNSLTEKERYPIIWFLIIFPFVVIGVFSWLVSRHYEKLYNPSDYGDVTFFLEALEKRRQGNSDIKNLEKLIDDKIKINIAPNNREEVAQNIKNGIRESYFTVDARNFTKSKKDIFKFPIWDFSHLSLLTDELYFLLQNHVSPYEYGYSWVMEDSETKEVVKNIRMLGDLGPGTVAKDLRPLSEVGISSGKIYYIKKP